MSSSEILVVDLVNSLLRSYSLSMKIKALNKDQIDGLFFADINQVDLSVEVYG